MTFDPQKHHRRSIRLPTWDYASAGVYFVTICVGGRAPVLGHVRDDDVVLSPAGRIVEDCWLQIPQHHAGVILDAHVVMPDHLHGIIVLPDSRSGLSMGFQRPVSGSLANVVASFKAAAAFQIRTSRPDFRWQRGFYEHVVRSEAALSRIRRYIADNPRRWKA